MYVNHLLCNYKNVVKNILSFDVLNNLGAWSFRSYMDRNSTVTWVPGSARGGGRGGAEMKGMFEKTGICGRTEFTEVGNTGGEGREEQQWEGRETKYSFWAGGYVLARLSTGL